MDLKIMIVKKVSCVLLLAINLSVFAQKNKSFIKTESAGFDAVKKLSHSDDFDGNTNLWIVEFENSDQSSIKTVNGKLDVSSAAGGTIWFKKKLKGNIMISYSVIVVDAGGPTDRVSDMNAFWMATNPNDQNLFKQDGKFTSYDQLNLYYAGVGGHDNRTTRFRKYEGKAGKDVLKEYTDQPHLLMGNKEYFIKIIVKNGLIQYYVNDNLYWEFEDPSPYKEGYFGFRTTKSHQLFDSFKVFQLK
jgi:hypothetical protein